MPVEHVWDESQEKYFDNHIFKSLDGVGAVKMSGIILRVDMLRSAALQSDDKIAFKRICDWQQEYFSI